MVEIALERLRSSANTCRDLASTSLTSEAQMILSELAEEFDRKARDQEENVGRRRIFVWPL